MSAYRFGPFSLDAKERRLVRGGAPISLTPKAFDTLVYLVQRHGHLVGKEELLDAVWPGAHVEEGSLPRAIHVLRRALVPPDAEDDVQYIETVPTKGYRFVADVTRLDGTAPRPEPPLPDAPSAREAERAPRGARGRRALAAAGALLFLALVGVAWRALARGTFRPPEAGRATFQTRSGAAYIRFESGRLHLDRHHRGDVEAAVQDFEAALQLDPGYAAAYAGKADARLFRYWVTGAHDDIAEARLAVRHAIELQPDSSYAHAMLRLLATYDWDFVGAETECRRAVGLDPGSEEARRELSFLLQVTGRPADALKEMDAAITLAPTSFNKRSRGLLLYLQRRFDAAIAQLTQVEATDPDYVESRRWIVRCLEQKRNYAEALDVLVRYRESSGAEPTQIARLRGAFAAGGWPNVLRASLQDGGTSNLDAAGTFAQLGQPDAAFDVLESMIRARRVMIVHMGSEPRLDPLRADPRFQRLARRVGLP